MCPRRKGCHDQPQQDVSRHLWNSWAYGAARASRQRRGRTLVCTGATVEALICVDLAELLVVGILGVSHVHIDKAFKKEMLHVHVSSEPYPAAHGRLDVAERFLRGLQAGEWHSILLLDAGLASIRPSRGSVRQRVLETPTTPIDRQNTDAILGRAYRSHSSLLGNGCFVGLGHNGPTVKVAQRRYFHLSLISGSVTMRGIRQCALTICTSHLWNFPDVGQGRGSTCKLRMLLFVG